jgi:undecaprenyl-diphosphatase
MNDTIFFFLYGLTHQSKIFDDIVIFFAVYFPYLVIILAGIFLLFHHDVFKAEKPFQVFLQKKKEILLVFFSGILAWLVDTVLKYLIHTPRPFDVFPQVHSLFAESWYSFPSGHATFFMALAVSIFLSHKKAGYLFMFFALLIGIARIIAGVHFPVDILGGFVIGALVAFFVKSV